MTPWTAAHQAPLTSNVSRSLLKLLPAEFLPAESVMLSNRLVLCRPLLLPSVFPSIRVFFSESALGIRWLKDETEISEPSGVGVMKAYLAKKRLLPFGETCKPTHSGLSDK